MQWPGNKNRKSDTSLLILVQLELSLKDPIIVYVILVSWCCIWGIWWLETWEHYLQVKSKHYDQVPLSPDLVHLPSHSLVGMLFCTKDTVVLIVLLLYYAVSCLCWFMLFPVYSFYTLPTLPGKLLLLLISLQASSLLWEVIYSCRQTKVSFPLCFHRTSHLYKFSERTLMVSKPSSELELLQVRESLIYYLILGPSWAKQMFRECLLNEWACSKIDSQQNRMPLGTLHSHVKMTNRSVNNFLAACLGLGLCSFAIRWRFLISSVCLVVYV